MILSPQPAERTALVCRAATRFCALRGWAPVQEMPLPNGRRADVLALLPDGGFAVVEVKSCARDFLSDAKWPEYRDYCDRLYFAVDLDFPRELLPEDAGLLVADGPEAALVREAAAARPDAIAIHCTNFRGAHAVPALEAETGIPVLDSVAVALWGALRAAGVETARLARWGRLFGLPQPA